jgi:hypothetical protein
MATRVILIAARNTTPEAFHEAFSGLPQPQASAGWCWLLLSLWGVPLKAVEQGLSRLPGPALRCHTEDDALWYLRLYSAGRRVYGQCCHLGLLRPSWPRKRSAGGFGTFLRDLYEHVPEDCKPPPGAWELDTLPLPEACARFLRLQAESISDALQGHGIPHDRQALLDCLTGASVSEPERGWGVGHLPRFLDLLGVPAFPGWQQGVQDELEQRERSEAEAAEAETFEDVPPDVAGRVLDLCAALDPAPLQGGPLPHPLTRLADVWHLGWFCDNCVDLTLILDQPHGKAVPIPWRSPDRAGRKALALQKNLAGLVQVREAGGHARIGLPRLPGTNAADWLQALGPALRALPDGSTLELLTADTQDESATGGRQRYRGTVQGGMWHISDAAPPVRREVLAEALALGAAAQAAEPIALRDVQEAHAVLAAAERSGFFQSLPRLRGKTLRCGRHERPMLAKLVFRERFRDVWNTREEEAEEAEQQEQIRAISERLDGALIRSLGTEHSTGEVLFEGQVGRFLRADIRKLKNPLAGGLAALFGQMYEGVSDQRPPEDRTVDETDQAMSELGFEPLGDLVCEPLGDVVVRGYAAVNGEAYGVLMRPAFGSWVREFYTRFDDGSSLTTSTHVASELPHKKIFRRSLPEGSIAELYEAHQAGIERHARKGRLTLHAEPRLEALARDLDEFLIRHRSG